MGAPSNEKSSVRNVLEGRTIPLLLVIVLLAAGFLGWVYWNRFQGIFSLQAEIAELEKEREELNREIANLRERLTRRNDVAYIEELAKEELGLVYPSDSRSEETE